MLGVRGGKKVCAYNMCLKLYLLRVQLYKLLLLESVSEYKYILPSVKTSYRNKNRCKNKTSTRKPYKMKPTLLLLLLLVALHEELASGDSCSTARLQQGILDRPNGIKRNGNPFSFSDLQGAKFMDTRKCFQQQFDSCCSLCTGESLYDSCWYSCTNKNHFAACNLAYPL